MAIVETTKNVTYANGSRVATIEQVITRADDYAKMGELYFRLADLWRRLEDDKTTEEERVYLEKDLEKVQAELAVQEGYVAGYNASIDSGEGA